MAEEVHKSKIREKILPDDNIISLANSFAATAGTNTRNATFEIVHSDLLNIHEIFINNIITSTI